MKSWLASAGARLAFSVDPLLAMAAGTMAVLLAGYLATIHWGGAIPTDGTGMVVGRDFLNFWMAGRAAFEAEPGRYYQPETYTALLEQMLGGRYMQQWSYPPMVLLFAAPFAALPYLAAYAVWTALGVGLLWCAVRLYRPAPGLTWTLMLSPAALLCFYCGQNALLTSAALLAAFHWRAARPWLAGLLIGLLCVKPQVAILLPVLLLAERNWRCMAAASITVLALIGTVTALYGVGLLESYWQIGMPAQGQVLREPAAVIAALMPTVFIQFWLLGFSYAPAMALQFGCSVAVVLLAYRAFRREAAPEVKLLLLAVGTVLATPYLLSYDVLLLGAACLLFAQTTPLQRAEKYSLSLVFFLPFVQVMAVLIGVPATFLPVLLLGRAAWRRLV